jgi:hypothetical protein
LTALWDVFFDQTLKVSLVADNHGTHTNPDILAVLKRTGVVSIWMPPNGSYFLPAFDLAIFGRSKQYSGNILEIGDGQKENGNWKAKDCLYWMLGITLRMLDVSTRDDVLRRLTQGLEAKFKGMGI